MRDDWFEWDDGRQPRTSPDMAGFSEARRAFDDPYAFEIEDRRGSYGEDRYVLLGMVGQRLLAVAHTLRGSALASSRCAQRRRSKDGCIMRRKRET